MENAADGFNVPRVKRRGSKRSIVRKISAIALSALLACSLVPVLPRQEAFAADWKATVQGNYAKAMQLANVKSFSGYCPKAVFYELKAYGILTTERYVRENGGCNGHDVAATYQKKTRTNGGYSVAYTAGSRSGGWAPFDKATNSGKMNGIYVVSYTSKSAPAYGHVNFLVIDGGNVYLADNYTYAGKKEGTGLSFSYASYKVAFSKMYPHVTGVVRFYKPTSYTPTCAIPTITASDILGGRRVGISSATSGSAIHYTVDGKTNPTASSGSLYSGSFDDSWPTMGVRAIASKAGYNTSGVAYKTITTATTSTPSISVANGPSGATVVASTATSGASIYYTLDGTNPSITGGRVANGTLYKGPITLTSNSMVKMLAVRSGMLASGVTSKSVVCTIPATPSPSADKGKVAAGDAVQVSWDADTTASEYVATLYRDGNVVETQTTKGAITSFVLDEAGDYQVSVRAKNAIGESAESSLVEVSAMAPCTVRFVDEADDGSIVVLNEQEVKYGYGAIAPAKPKKKGYTFSEWKGSFDCVTADIDVSVAWDINSYVVQFYAQNGTTQLSRQVVDYRSSAQAPDPGTPPTGYIFSGWAVVDADDDSDRDFMSVDSDMKLRAVWAWEDAELPVVAEIAKAERTASGNYSVSVRLTNRPSSATTAFLRVALKTQQGKLVQTARDTVEIDAGGTAEKTITLKYNGDYIATLAEVELVGCDGNYRTGGAYSKAVTAPVKSCDDFSYSPWSEWTTEPQVASETTEVEEGIQYRYRDKQTTTSTSTSLSGWTRDGSSTASYGGWGSVQSTTSRPATSDTLQITNQYTSRYNYYHWCSKYDNCWNHDSVWVNSTSVKHTTSTTSPIKSAANKFADKGGRAAALCGPYGSCAHHTSGHTYWWLESTVTTYQYQTRSKTVTYGYYKWGDWSEWALDEVSADSSREVESRTVYRIREKIPNDLSGNEDQTGSLQDVSGSLDVGSDLSGKEATIMVYNATNVDPNEDQMQYIGQTVIGEGNSYSFSFIPKNDPTPESGDYIVSLGVKGSTGLVNVATIKAPKPQYRVTYQYQDDQGRIQVVDSQMVPEGESAVVPEAPAREGHRFLGWSSSATKVNIDMVVNALYEPKTCTVAWVDWVDQSVFLESLEYGQPLVAPVEPSEKEGYEFRGWDAVSDGCDAVTQNMVVNAVYEKKSFKVTFSDGKDGVFQEQNVAFGEAAVLPTTEPALEGQSFVGWDTSENSNWWSVREDVVVEPIFKYAETANTPVGYSDKEGGYVGAEGATVYFESSTENAVIRYTIDGADPTEESPIYDMAQGVTVKEPCTIKAVAFAESKNASAVTSYASKAVATNDLSNANIAVVDVEPYVGTPVKAGIMVLLGGEPLVEGVDYLVSYRDNAHPGVATATVEGTGKYIGAKSVQFDVVRAQDGISGSEIEDNPSLPSTSPSDSESSGTGVGDRENDGTWRKDSTGWWYLYATGGYPKSCWEYVDGKWYYFDRSGYMQTGWQRVGGTWYYLDPSTGAMATGWASVDGTWYYLEDWGGMAEGWAYVGGIWYYLEPGSGAMATGWKSVGGTWYYLKGSGAMAEGWQQVGSTWYYLNPGSGAMAEGWKLVGGDWYYLTPGSGAMRTGWYQVGGTWYYFNSSGRMLADCWVDGTYWVGPSGAMATSSWVDGGRYWVGSDGRWVA